MSFLLGLRQLRLEIALGCHDLLLDGTKIIFQLRLNRPVLRLNALVGFLVQLFIMRVLLIQSLFGCFCVQNETVLYLAVPIVYLFDLAYIILLPTPEFLF